MFSAERMAGRMCREKWKSTRKCWRKKEMLRVGLSLHYTVLTFSPDVLMWQAERASETELLPWGIKYSTVRIYIQLLF